MTEMNYNLLFAENVVLVTERLTLRPLTLADAPDMYEYASDEETCRFVFERHTSLADTRSNLANYFLAGPLGKFGMELKETGKMIGTIDLRLTPEHRRGEIGYTLNKLYWGQGYTTEASKKLIQFGFETLQLERIFAMHDVRNPASGRVMAKSGLKKEGLHCNARIFRGQPVDDIYYGISRQEYIASQE